MLPASLHSGVLHFASPNRMFPPKLDLADGRQESSSDHWLQQQMKKAMSHLPSDLEVVPSPLLLEEMELAPAGPGSGRGGSLYVPVSGGGEDAAPICRAVSAAVDL
ncbi:hypothetical protein ATANTOWER_031922 [Ataeniobius toweri]|uniref:Uncharacterized protein n=1 Tax=Ataeniobius toweri TaxID=208326 RepID=A0ABU7A8S2_9TELE|nr:hypothetical protein [Ataeniobius toweri]